MRLCTAAAPSPARSRPSATPAHSVHHPIHHNHHHSTSTYGSTHATATMGPFTDSDSLASLYIQPENCPGSQLEGREILLCWDDGVWYEAIIVCYYPLPDEYKLVYRADDAIEITRLRDRRWVLAPKKRTLSGDAVLDGAIIEFEYPTDGKKYRGMIYDYSHKGDRLKIAYIDEHSTDNLKGGGWDFVTESPCMQEDTEEEPEQPVPPPAQKREAPVRVITKRTSRSGRRNAPLSKSVMID